MSLTAAAFLTVKQDLERGDHVDSPTLRSFVGDASNAVETLRGVPEYRLIVLDLNALIDKADYCLQARRPSSSRVSYK